MASIYKLKDQFLVHADAMTTAGLWMASAPFISLRLDSDAHVVGRAVLSALSESTHDAPHPLDWRAATTARLVAAGAPSERSFQQDALLVKITLNGSAYFLEPQRNGGTSGADKGFHPMTEMQHSISLDCSAEEIGSAAIEAVAACAARPGY